MSFPMKPKVKVKILKSKVKRRMKELRKIIGKKEDWIKL